MAPEHRAVFGEDEEEGHIWRHERALAKCPLVIVAPHVERARHARLCSDLRPADEVIHRVVVGLVLDLR
eukprot:16241235-Heterocapsa_arctica.AAC.1